MNTGAWKTITFMGYDTKLLGQFVDLNPPLKRKLIISVFKEQVFSLNARKHLQKTGDIMFLKEKKRLIDL
jgi:hypothetical protein